MKPTKKAKSATIRKIHATTTVLCYTCPSCQTAVKDYSLSDRILRVKCGQCGQEIILEHQGE